MLENDSQPPSHFFQNQQSGGSDTTRPGARIEPFLQFVGSFVPNWLMRHDEISQGAKLAYGRLSQYAGPDGACFPKQRTLAAELGVSERTANEYIRDLADKGLIEKERPGLGRPNRYYFLDHPWMYELPPEKTFRSPGQIGRNQHRQSASNPDPQILSAQDTNQPSVPYTEENQSKENQKKTIHTHARDCLNLPQSLEEALTVAKDLGIDEEFAKQEYHSKKAVNWKDGFRNSITSWPDHLQVRWGQQKDKRALRPARSRPGGQRPAAPARQFNATDYNQSTKDF